MYRRFFKRFIDIAISLIMIILLSPIYLILAILICIKLGKPVLFRQARPGKDEKIFNLYKFRSMTDARDENGDLLPDADRLPAFGRRLRATSLDELPELINILKGDMSIIGPRPLLVKYLPYYTEEERVRHSVRPGLTGYAQVHGRNALSWEQRFEHDVYYVRHISFLLDIKIIIDTVKAVITHEGVELNALEDFDEYRKKKSVSDLQA